VQVAEWVLTGLGREGEQVGSQGWPSGFGGESGEVLVGLVELCDGLGSEELFGCDVEAVGVALHRLEVNRPGFGGDIDPTERWSHVSTEEASARGS
jgi:hypothetical protein